jgi:hypothetical protein
MRIFQRRSVTFISGAVGTAALTLLLMAPRPMVRPAVRPVFPVTTSSTITRTSPVGSATLHSTTSLSSSVNSLTATRTTNLNETINGHTASFTATRTLTETPSTANTLTATRTVTLTETINGHTTSVTATNSATATPLTAAQVAGVVLTERVRHREVVALRQAELASASPGYGSSQTAYPSAAPSNAGGGYGGGVASAYGGLAYGDGPSRTTAPGTAPDVLAAGYEENKGASPGAESRAARDEKAVNRLLAADGVTDEEGHLLWPVGLRALPGDRVGKLRDQIAAFLAQEREEAVSGVVTAHLYLDLTSSVDALRKRLMLDREERFSLTHQAYEDAEDYLAKLKRAAKSLAEAGKPAGDRLPE